MSEIEKSLSNPTQAVHWVQVPDAAQVVVLVLELSGHFQPKMQRMIEELAYVRLPVTVPELYIWILAVKFAVGSPQLITIYNSFVLKF